MIDYFDTSALVKCYIEEEGSSIALELAMVGNRVYTSRVTEIEVVSSLARRTREGSISLTQLDTLRIKLAEDRVRWEVVEVSSMVVDLAKNLARRLPLRAYDATQLASAHWVRDNVNTNVRFVCSDASLVKIAKSEGLGAVLLR